MISDHADWDELTATIGEVDPQETWITHGREDALLLAEIDLGDIPRAQMDFDPVGHYARPDVFQLAVNTAQQQAVRAAPGWPEQ